MALASVGTRRFGRGALAAVGVCGVAVAVAPVASAVPVTASRTIVTASPAGGAPVGQLVVFQPRVTAVAGGVTRAAGGAVTVTITGPGTFVRGATIGAAGTVQVPITFSVAGTYVVVAHYRGHTGVAPSSGLLTYRVTAAGG